MQSQFDVQITQMKTQMEEQMTHLQQEMLAHLERVGYPLTPTTHTSRSRADPSIPSSTGQVSSVFITHLLIFLLYL